MLKKFYYKSQIWFTIVWIIIYCVFMSTGDILSTIIGIEKSLTLPISFCMSAILFYFLKENNLLENYGLCAPKVTPSSMLYYLPLVIMLTANLWYGLTVKYSFLESVLYILTMFFVGFLEEIIFRGLLFNSIREHSVKFAIIISSTTFGIGHIINLVSGSGVEIIPNLLQVIYATAAGLMFVMIYYKSKSLILCIIAHGLFNALSAFSNEESSTIETRIITAIILTLITASYSVQLIFTLKNK